MHAFKKSPLTSRLLIPVAHSCIPSLAHSLTRSLNRALTQLDYESSIVGGLVFMYCNPCKPGGESCASRVKDLLPTSSSGSSSGRSMRSKRVRQQEEKAIEVGVCVSE